MKSAKQRQDKQSQKDSGARSDSYRHVIVPQNHWKTANIRCFSALIFSTVLEQLFVLSHLTTYTHLDTNLENRCTS